MNLATYAKLPHTNLSMSEILCAIKRENILRFAELYESYNSKRYAKAILLKLSNLVLLRTHFERKHTRLLSKPIAFIVDPANSCQLKCPGCIHREGAELSTWDKNILDENKFNTLARELGPYAFHCVFFNWGEPLINRNLPSMIKTVRQYLLSGHISSNLSLTFDVEALVASGLEQLTVSVDGVTQSTIQRYRIGARPDLIFANMRSLVEAKRKLNSYTPIINWQYLMFDHNIHEMDEAEELAKKIGVNVLHFARPYQFAMDEYQISMRNIPEADRKILDYEGREIKHSYQRLAASLNEYIDEEYDNFMIRMSVAPIYEEQERAKNACPWLYEQTVMDANGRMIPCCAPPANQTWMFGSIDDPDIFNSESYLSARELGSRKKTACHTCTIVDPKPNITTWEHFPQYLYKIDFCDRLQTETIKSLWTEMDPSLGKSPRS
ncbi:MAG: SPASM domain-containing protein [Methylocella sp.]